MRILILLCAAALLAACNVKPEPFDAPQPDEMHNEPGLLSGEDGKWSVFIPYE